MAQVGTAVLLQQIQVGAKRIIAGPSGTAFAYKGCTCCALSLEPARRLGEMTSGYFWPISRHGESLCDLSVIPKSDFRLTNVAFSMTTQLLLGGTNLDTIIMIH